jgi:hypothetical protein
LYEFLLQRDRSSLFTAKIESFPSTDHVLHNRDDDPIYTHGQKRSRRPTTPSSLPLSLSLPSNSSYQLAATATATATATTTTTTGTIFPSLLIQNIYFTL